MRRREFIMLGGAAATWPLAVPAQTNQMRRIGVLMGLVAPNSWASAECPLLGRTGHAGLGEGREMTGS
jgi:hypothetical protein